METIKIPIFSQYELIKSWTNAKFKWSNLNSTNSKKSVHIALIFIEFVAFKFSLKNIIS